MEDDMWDEKSRGVMLAAKSLADTCESIAKMMEVIGGGLSDVDENCPEFYLGQIYGEQSYNQNNAHKWIMEYWGACYQPVGVGGAGNVKLKAGDQVIAVTVQFYSRRLKELEQAELWMAICSMKESPHPTAPIYMLSGAYYRFWDEATRKLPEYGRWMTSKVAKSSAATFDFTLSRQPLCKLENRDAVKELVVIPLKKRYHDFTKASG
ncbi:MAG: hypothetical protein COR54_02290 [Elusimicrobia bacterium CG22_combo_CG10-13_8_21_14_all_63_91]|nr:MAG: hypothetical protein COR54_02290 [Elusimicrobia bacterium CG22_combo_CG10-13_8_21_14_all_63_91]PJA14714.1 MAG: hypothetical protein COX66_11920 [Elusimicrobia bacterium CG_4_10_14_0_2_um_filter_63_34]